MGGGGDEGVESGGDEDDIGGDGKSIAASSDMDE